MAALLLISMNLLELAQVIPPPIANRHPLIESTLVFDRLIVIEHAQAIYFFAFGVSTGGEHQSPKCSADGRGDALASDKSTRRAESCSPISARADRAMNSTRVRGAMTTVDLHNGPRKMGIGGGAEGFIFSPPPPHAQAPDTANAKTAVVRNRGEGIRKTKRENRMWQDRKSVV